MDLGKSLKIAIATKGVKSQDLATALETQPQQVSSWKRTGNIKQSTLVRICKFFDMEVSDFIKLGE